MIEQIIEYLLNPDQFRAQMTDDNVVALFRKETQWDNEAKAPKDVETVFLTISLADLLEAQEALNIFAPLAAQFEKIIPETE